jgi:hypothetical protein
MRFSRIAAIAILSTFVCFAQESRGTISGAVTDPSGAPVAGAKVVATEIRTGTKVQTVSEPTGQYSLPFLSSGEYTVSATLQGFKEAIRKGIAVGAGDRVGIDIRLEVGETSTSVEVTAEAPLLNTENASQGQAITTKEVEDMPLNGGTPAMLSQFALGVIPTGNPTLVHPFDVGGPSAVSIGGTPSQTSELLLDGVPNATWDGRQAYSPPRDAVQEVRVKAFDSDSSFGHTGGGTLNQVLKTGTNSFHGTLWEYNQPSNLTANSFFNNRAGVKASVTHYNQYGVVVSGPVVLPKFNGRDKLFWMFAYEGLPDSQPNPTNLTVPTAAEKQGDFSALLKQGSQYQLYDPFTATLTGTTINRSPIPNNIIPQNRLNPIALNFMKFYPEPNTTVGVSPIGANNYISNVPTTDDYNNELGRLDYNMSDRNRMFFDVRRFGYSQEKQNYFQNPASGIATFRESWGSTLDDVVTLTPTTVLNARLNFTRLGEGHGVTSHGIDITSLGFPASFAAASPYTQLPIMSLSTFQQLGGNSTKSNNYPSQSWQFFGQLVKIRGNHSLKIGTDLRQYRVNPIDYGNSEGIFSFANTWVRSSSTASSTVAQGQDLASMLMGLPTGGSFDVNSFASFYSYYASGFIQDDWRATHNLTINIGIRYDFDGPYHEKWARTVNGFAADQANPISAAAKAAYAAKPNALLPASAFNVNGGLTFASPNDTRVYQNTSHLASPRVGLAWSPDFLKHKTVIRTGFGMFVTPVTIASLSVNGNYSTNPILAQEGFSQTTNMVVSNDNNLTPAATLSNPYPAGIVQPAGASAGLTTFNGQTINFLNPKMKSPYSLRWNFGIQHEITPNTMLEIAYIGNHSVHLPITVTQLNGIPRQYLSTLPVRDAAVNATMAATTPNPFQGLLPSTSSMNTASTITVAQLLSRYPQYPVGYGSGVWSGSTGVLAQDLDLGSSYFGSLNVRVQRRLSKGLSIIGNYIWSRLTEQDSWLNDSDLSPEKRISPFDRPQRIVTAVSWDLPIGKGRLLNVNSRIANAIVGGWHLNSVYTWQIGAPLSWVNGSTTTPSDYVYFGGPGALPASLNAREANTQANGTPIAAFDTSVFNTNSANAFAYHIRTFSTTFPNVRADGINEWDPSLLKRISVTEKAYVQLRFEFFNVVNHPTFGAPNVQWSSGPSSFGVINSQSNRPRTVQFGARVVW